VGWGGVGWGGVGWGGVGRRAVDLPVFSTGICCASLHEGSSHPTQWPCGTAAAPAGPKRRQHQSINQTMSHLLQQAASINQSINVTSVRRKHRKHREGVAWGGGRCSQHHAQHFDSRWTVWPAMFPRVTGTHNVSTGSIVTCVQHQTWRCMHGLLGLKWCVLTVFFLRVTGTPETWTHYGD
jgi:hypothetical protein